MTTIFLNAWYDISLVTLEVLQHPDFKDVESLKNEFCIKYGIHSFSGLPENMWADCTDKFKEFLVIEHGFKIIDGTSVYFTD